MFCLTIFLAAAIGTRYNEAHATIFVVSTLLLTVIVATIYANTGNRFLKK